MNRLFITGNLCKDPELRTTQSGISVCTFNVAVNRRRKQEGQPDADFFRVTAWREMGVNCSKFLSKGRKVAVTGSIRLGEYKANSGENKAFLDMLADEVEFLSPKGEQQEPKKDQQTGFTEVDASGDLPF